MLCIWWDQLDVVYYELLKPTETITRDRYWLQLIHLGRALKKKKKKKRPLYVQKHDKVILERDIFWSHVTKRVKTYLETSK